jgi:chromosome segregation ATPase
LRSELAAEQEAALLAQKNQLETEALAAREEALAKQRRRYEQEAQDTAAKMRAERDDALFKLRTEMEDTAADIAKAHAAVIEDWERRAEDFRGKISSLETSLEQQRLATNQAQTRAETTQHALDVRTSELIAAKEHIDELTAEKATLEDKLAASLRYSSDLRNTLSDREERIAVLEANLVATSEVVSRNEELIGRTRQALAIATQLLEQVESIQPFNESEDM